VARDHVCAGGEERSCAPAHAAPLVVAVGLAELPELIRQSDEYARAWQGRGLPGRYLPLTGHEHFSILEQLARPGGALLAALQDLAATR
jgi:arylformamidase